jgi:LPXTG-motif cell wall-anchored protein
VLAITQGELNALSFGFLLGVPLLLLVSGGVIAWRRRRR